MKYNIIFYSAIISLLTFNGVAQTKELSKPDPIAQNDHTASNDLAQEELVIVSYHVVESIKKSAGSSITSYDVNSLSMIDSNDLGPNNTRVITPRYVRKKIVKAPVTANQGTTAIVTKDQKAKEEAAKIEAAITEVVKEEIKKTEANPPIAAPSKEGTTKPTPVKKETYVNIDIIDTYERVLAKGYKSADMLKKVADRYFFNNDLVTAAKWYGQLFDITTDFDTIYYYRYGKSLEAINQPEKANQMLDIFKKKSN